MDLLMRKATRLRLILQRKVRLRLRYISSGHLA